jgi:hypothetical protein
LYQRILKSSATPLADSQSLTSFESEHLRICSPTQWRTYTIANSCVADPVPVLYQLVYQVTGCLHPLPQSPGSSIRVGILLVTEWDCAPSSGSCYCRLDRCCNLQSLHLPSRTHHNSIANTASTTERSVHTERY